MRISCALSIIAGILFSAFGTASAFAAEPSTQAEGAPPAPVQPKTVAILLFEGVELMDFTGPAEVFLLAEKGKGFRLVTVAESTKPLKTMGGITVVPDHSFATAPPAAVLVVPGGNLKAVGNPGREWLKKASGESEITLSVCFGAFLLAEAGMLDGIEATTHHWGIQDLKTAAPKCKVVTGKRFVDAGRIVTTAGVTAGIDGALHVVSRMFGEDAEKWVAEEWMEHRMARAPTPSSADSKAND